MRRSLILACTLILSAFFAEPASAWLQQMVRAQGAGTVPGSTCDTAKVPACMAGDEVSFYFVFRGDGTGTSVPVEGTFTAIDLQSGVRLDFSGAGTVFPATHELQVTGMCLVTTPSAGTVAGSCTLLAIDGTPSMAPDTIFISGSAGTESVSAAITPTSGNITIN